MSNIDLRLGDCLDVMKTLADASVDAVITDPPYGVDFRGNDWDAFIPQWIAEARRIAKSVLFTTAPTTQWDYPRPDWVGCWYRSGATSRSLLGGFNHWTPVIIYGKPRFKVDGYRTSTIVVTTANKGIDHPSPKPIDLMEWMIQNATREGDTVLDPFMGSGTTGVACVKLNRNFIGIEINPQYYAIAQRRIAEAQAQMALPMVTA